MEKNSKVVAFYDTEAYPNFWLLRFRLSTGIEFSFTAPLSLGDRQRIDYLFRTFTTVSFNGNGYDIPMISGALLGYDCEELKQVNNRIIVEQIKPWELGLPEWRPHDHIDVMETAPGTGSLKQYAARIHCKRIQDLPYPPDKVLTEDQKRDVFDYCGNDLTVLADLYYALQPQIEQRVALGARYGIDLRSKSDAQVAEAILKLRCEKALGRRIYKPEFDWNLKFQYRAPDYLRFQLPQLQRVFDLIKSAIFEIGPSGAVVMPKSIEGLEIGIGNSVYKLGIGGLHSQEKCAKHLADDGHALIDADVAAYYPTLMLNSGAFPQALGEQFLAEYAEIKKERMQNKAEAKRLKDVAGPEYISAKTGDEGGKIMINGTFGKTGSPYSILNAPQMLIQTTVTGQLALLMLIEAHESVGIPIVSANTDGIVIKCPRNKIEESRQLIANWEKATNLEMETAEYRALYSRDINNYFAVKIDGSVKRKGEYSKAGITEKKNPDVEICSDAVADFLASGMPIAYTLAACLDIRKFLIVQKVAGGGVKLWGEGPRKDILVRDMAEVLLANGWSASGRLWARSGIVTNAREAYQQCFSAQRPEYLGKVVRWYYGTHSPGPIVYATNGNTVSLSYGAKPCMTLPDEFPTDIDYEWYLTKCESILKDISFK